MGSLNSDTNPLMESLQTQYWRTASPTRKMQMVAELNNSARILACAGLKARNPQASESELNYYLAVLLLGEELAHKVYGEIVDEK